jgi:hypothetical protein
MQYDQKAFNSLSEAIEFVQRSPHTHRHDHYDEATKFYGFMDLKGAIAYLQAGAQANSREMRAAVALLDKIDSSAHNRHRDTWQAREFGGYAVVPEYLAGMPMNMRHREPDESDVSPIKIYLEPVVSAGVDETELLRRGAAIAALAQRMSEERPTELHVAAALGGGQAGAIIYDIRLDTCPINLAQAVAVFATPQFARKFSFNLADAIAGTNRCFNGGWGFAHPDASRSRERSLRKALDCQPQDIVLVGGYLDDAKLMRENPVEWVNRQLEKQRNLSDE